MSLPASIDTLKSTIGNRGGIARGNRFAVYITHPEAANNTLFRFDPETIISNLIGGNSITAGNFINDPRDMFLLCESVSLPGKRIATTEQVHNHHAEKMPYSAITEEVTMTFLLTNDYHTKKYFDSWQNMVVDTSGKHYKPAYKKSYTTDIIIQQLSASNDVIPGYTVKLENAYPLQVSSVELSNSAENAALSVSVTIEYDIWREVGMVDGFNELIERGKDLIGNLI